MSTARCDRCDRPDALGFVSLTWELGGELGMSDPPSICEDCWRALCLAVADFLRPPPLPEGERKA